MNSAAKANQMMPRLTCSDELQPAVCHHLLPHAEFNQQHGENGQRDEDHRHTEQTFQPPAQRRIGLPPAQSRQPDPAVHVRVVGHTDAGAGRGRRVSPPRCVAPERQVAVAHEVLDERTPGRTRSTRLPGTSRSGSLPERLFASRQRLHRAVGSEPRPLAAPPPSGDRFVHHRHVHPQHHDRRQDGQEQQRPTAWSSIGLRRWLHACESVRSRCSGKYGRALSHST